MKLRLLYLFAVAAPAVVAGSKSNADADSWLYRLGLRHHLRATPTARSKSTAGQTTTTQQAHHNRKLEEYEWIGRNPTVKLTRCQGEHMICFWFFSEFMVITKYRYLMRGDTVLLRLYRHSPNNSLAFCERLFASRSKAIVTMTV